MHFSNFYIKYEQIWTTLLQHNINDTLSIRIKYSWWKTDTLRSIHFDRIFGCSYTAIGAYIIQNNIGFMECMNGRFIGILEIYSTISDYMSNIKILWLMYEDILISRERRA